jgi:hypothetical protein
VVSACWVTDVVQADHVAPPGGRAIEVHHVEVDGAEAEELGPHLATAQPRSADAPPRATETVTGYATPTLPPSSRA